MATYEKSNLAWQLRQLQQQLSEWWELKISRFTPDLFDKLKLSRPSWLDSPFINFVGQVTFWLLLAFILSWIIIQVMRRLSPYLYHLQTQLNQRSDRSNQTELQGLSMTAWLERSRKLRQQGNYREACLCLYQAMLQRLHEKEMIPHQPSRTDGEYRQLIQQFPQPDPYEFLLITHEQLCFNNTEASSSLLAECQQAYQDIEQ